MMRLDQLPTGRSATIDAISGDNPFAQRLMALGLLPGLTVTLVAVAPMGDPIGIEIAGRRLSIRRADAATVSVTPL